jgi:hypothetical protein
MRTASIERHGPHKEPVERLHLRLSVPPADGQGGLPLTGSALHWGVGPWGGHVIARYHRSGAGGPFGWLTFGRVGWNRWRGTSGHHH